MENHVKLGGLRILPENEVKLDGAEDMTEQKEDVKNSPQSLALPEDSSIIENVATDIISQELPDLTNNIMSDDTNNVPNVPEEEVKTPEEGAAPEGTETPASE